MREVPFGNDGDFARDAMIRRINSDLANGIGNLAQRTLSQIAKNCGGKVPAYNETPDEHRLLALSHRLLSHVRNEIDVQAFHKALDHVWAVIGETDKYIDMQAPWALKKTDPARMETVLYAIAETLRRLAILLQPFMPDAMNKLLDQLAISSDQRDFSCLAPESKDCWLKPGTPLPAPQGIFPRYVEAETPAETT
jgi:methionyl-tRNA synthetase